MIARRAARIVSAAACGVVIALLGATAARADAVRDQQWALGFLKVSELHAISQGAGITIAVVDSGVDARHPDLARNVVKGTDVSRGGDGSTADVSGHGTAVAALIAGHGHGSGNSAGILGIAPAAKIVPVRVHQANVPFGHPDDVANGIVAAADAGAKVICVASAGSSTPGLERAIAYAHTKDSLVVAGVGNTDFTKSIAWPAAYPTVVAVAGVNRSGQISAISARGSDYAGIAVAAPSDDVVSALPGGRYAANTEQATPPHW